MPITTPNMKKFLCLAAGLLALNLAPVWGQPDPFAKATDSVMGKPADIPLQKPMATSQPPPQKKIKAAPATGTKLDPAAAAPVVPRKVYCRLYPLATCLDRGFTADDLTAAIQAGWKKAGETAPPEMKYQPEARVLIAYGEPGKLKVIGAALNSLAEGSASTVQGLAEKIRVEEFKRREKNAEKIAAARTASPAASSPGVKTPDAVGKK